MSFKIKVCGMKYSENIQEVVKLKPDLLGFIFFNKSKRFVGEDFDVEIVRSIPSEIKKVGVFVNADFQTLLTLKNTYSLDYLQLHGEETPELCKKLKNEGCKIIKVFSVDNFFDFSVLQSYESFCDFFLFDTKGENYGGNGITFNWDILNNYKSNTPYLLSGGVGLENIDKVKDSILKSLYGVDVNSKFETSPGIKDLSELKVLFNKIRV